MIAPRRLTIDLLSETTFGGGGITPGEVEIEIDHDDLGLPRLSAKAIHGLFRDTWLSMQEVFGTDEYKESAARLFGLVADFGEETSLRIGDAEVDEATRSVVRRAVTREDAPLSPRDILHALTNVRTQTSESRESGAPEEGTLRSSRVLIRGLRLFCRLEWLATPEERDLEVLALTVLTTRHAGMARNRGRGHVRILFDGDLQATRAAVGTV